MTASVGNVLSVSVDGVEVVIDYVAFGDVYVCSGQSNIEIGVSATRSLDSRLSQTASLSQSPQVGLALSYIPFPECALYTAANLPHLPFSVTRPSANQITVTVHSEKRHGILHRGIRRAV